MRLVRCEHCNIEVRVTEYGIPPVGWVQILMQGPMLEPPPDFCGLYCAGQWMIKCASVKPAAVKP
jgi:hypothetical protein